MLLPALRSLWVRRLTYSLVFVELIIGFLCLTLATAVWDDIWAVGRRVRAAAPPQTLDIWLYNCQAGPLEALAGGLRRDPAVAGVALVYYLGGSAGSPPVSLGLDAATAELVPKQVAAGRWFAPADFAPGGGPIPVVLGSAVQPGLGVGGTISNPYAGEFIVVGRLKPRQVFWHANGSDPLIAIAAADDMLLMPMPASAPRNEVRRSVGYMVRLLVFPRGSSEAATALDRAVKDDLHGTPFPRSGMGTPGVCHYSPPTTLATALQTYYDNNRDVRYVVTGIAGVILSIGLLGYSGVALVAVERRTREFALRLAMGATTGALAGQVLWEMLLLALLAAGVGIPLGSMLAGQARLPITGTVVAFTLVIGTLEAALAALGPLLTIVRRPPADYIRSGR